jgi:hypothetical protein
VGNTADFRDTLADTPGDVFAPIIVSSWGENADGLDISRLLLPDIIDIRSLEEVGTIVDGCALLIFNLMISDGAELGMLNVDGSR